MKVGDTIKLTNSREALELAKELAAEGIITDFKGGKVGRVLEIKAMEEDDE